MRLITSKLESAFPELDGFARAKAKAFVDAVGRSSWTYRVGIVLLSVGGFIVFAFVAIFLMVLFAGSIDRFDRQGSLALYGVVMVVPLLGGLCLVLFVRDRFLARRIRAILDSQARCPACSYELLGLSRDASSTITCPECGRRTVVDPSFDTLTGGCTPNEAKADLYLATHRERGGPVNVSLPREDAP
ncbi:hypothetical protein BH11PLA1_BH11PLA1_19430 [soil metagenome]